jgi:hypothetical protein
MSPCLRGEVVVKLLRDSRKTEAAVVSGAIARRHPLDFVKDVVMERDWVWTAQVRLQATPGSRLRLVAIFLEADMSLGGGRDDDFYSPQGGLKVRGA